MKNYKPYHVQQRDTTDCGVACLLSVLRFYESDASLEQLRELSGTATTGTTLLGLYQSAKKINLNAEGFEADLEHLKTLESPAILHIIKEENLLHYVVCYGYDKEKDVFIISDPAEAHIAYLKPEALEKIWQTKTLLLLTPSEKLKKVARTDTFWNKVKWLYNFVQTDLDLLLIALVLGAVISALGVSIAIFSQKLVDDILPAKDLTKLLAGCGLLLFVLLVKVFFTYIRQLFLLRQSKDFNTRIIYYFYSTLLSLPKAFFDSRKTGDLMARMNDTARIQQTISNIFSNLAIEIIVVVVNTVVLFMYNVTIGWISLLWLPLFGLIAYRYNKKLIEGQRRVMVTYAFNESNYIDTIQGIGAIKVANRQNHFSALTKLIYTVFQESRYQLGLVGNNFGIASQLAGVVFIVGIMFGSSLMVFQGVMTIGAVMAITQMIGMMMASASEIAIVNITLQEARVALDRMQEFTTLPAEYDPAIEATKPQLTDFQSLEVEEVNFRFTGRPILLKDISLDVKKGEIIAILGESGCGKSTLLQILQRFYEAESGTVLVNNQPLEGIAIPTWRNLLGVVPQDIKLFNGSLYDNILMSDITEAEIEKVNTFFQEYGFDQYFEKFPYGYNTLLGETGVNISGGQKQLVGLARALYHQPQLLLLDEATAAMDRYTERSILQLLERLRPEMGIIMVTHRSRAAAIADRIYIIENGEIVESGNQTTLLQTKNLYSESVVE